MNPREETTEKNRQARKLFQNYFTSCLYKSNSASEDHFQKRSNIVISNACSELWKLFRETFYRPNEALFGWDNIIRLYLKGGKSTLLDMPGETTRNNIARLFYSTINTETSDSDYDFCAVVNPVFVDELERFKPDIDFIMGRVFNKLKQELHLLELEQLLGDINSHYFQYKILFSSLIRDNLLTEFTNPRDQSVLNSFISYCNVNSANSNVSGFFKFSLSDEPLGNSESLVNLTTDQFYLYRIFINFTLENHDIDLCRNKYFAECIDVSLSTNLEVTRLLWNKTSLDRIQHNVQGFDPNGYFLYPVVGLDYQLDDIIHIIAETSPNKPDKRCKRFIEQLYFSCINQKLPNLPEIITIGKDVHDLMISENTNTDRDRDLECNCSLLENILDYVRQYRINDQEFYEYTPKQSISSLGNFEDWCREQTDYNLKWESSCNLEFISKEVLITSLITMNNELFPNEEAIPRHKLENLTKYTLCFIYKDLICIETILKIWLHQATMQLIHSIHSVAAPPRDFSRDIITFINEEQPRVLPSEIQSLWNLVVSIIRYFFRRNYDTIENGEKLKDFVIRQINLERRINNYHQSFVNVLSRIEII